MEESLRVLLMRMDVDLPNGTRIPREVGLKAVEEYMNKYGPDRMLVPIAPPDTEYSASVNLKDVVGQVKNLFESYGCIWADFQWLETPKGLEMRSLAQQHGKMLERLFFRGLGTIKEDNTIDTDMEIISFDVTEQSWTG